MTAGKTRFLFDRKPVEGGRLEGVLEIGDRREPFFFESRDAELVPCNEAFTALALLPSMRAGYDIRIEGPISRKFAEGVGVVTDVYHAWHPDLSRVHLSGGERVRREGAAGRGVGLFFSGGVDSTYTLLKHMQEITHLIFLGGFEKGSLEGPGLGRAVQAIREVGAHLGKVVIFVDTNLRAVLSGYRLPWGRLAFGSAQVAVAQMLAPVVQEFFMAGGHTYAHLMEAGNHPLVDRHWGTEAVAFVHDGAEADRIQKIHRIAESEPALQWLRVCTQPPPTDLNCGKCEKCMRTMINLHIAGALERCLTLPHRIDPAAIARLDVPNENRRAYFEQNIRRLGPTPTDRRIARALRRAIVRSDVRRGARALARGMLSLVAGRGSGGTLPGPDPRAPGSETGTAEHDD